MKLERSFVQFLSYFYRFKTALNLKPLISASVNPPFVCSPV